MRLITKSIIFILIISLLSVSFCFTASALVIYEGDFGFEVNTSTHEAALVAYTGDGGAVVIPNDFQGYPVTVIDHNAFSGNESITEVVFAETNTTIEEYAFMKCTSLETVVIPESVVTIGDRAFADCTSLQTVTMLSDIVSMPTNMFSGCTALCELTLSESIVDFGYGCFNGCSALTDLDFVSRGVMLDSFAFNGTGAESVVLSDALLAIPNYAFTNCPRLTYVTIPESVVLIQPYAFDWNSVTIRCIPDSYAHIFAEENGVPYELLEAYLLGDADGDGEVTIIDATYIQRWLVRLSLPSALDESGADTNGDGVVKITDVTYLQRWLVGIEIPYPVNSLIYKY